MTAALLIVLSAGPAFPQNAREIQHMKDVIDLLQLVRQLQTSVEQNDALMKGLIEKMADQVNTLSTGMKTITQAVDSIKGQNDASAKEMRAALKTVTDSVKELQGDLSSARAQINTVSKELTTMKTTAEPLAGPDDLWRTAFLDYSAGNWDLAIAGLQEFLSKYPTDARAAEAEMRIGNAQFAVKKYDLAITQFDIVLQKYPESDTTRAALLKKGLALAETNPPQAINVLNEVAKKYPGTVEAANAQAKLKELQPAQRGRAPAK